MSFQELQEPLLSPNPSSNLEKKPINKNPMNKMFYSIYGGGIFFILFLVSLVFMTINFIKMRKEKSYKSRGMMVVLFLIIAGIMGGISIYLLINRS